MTEIRCTGRAVDTALNPRGPECGNTYRDRPRRTDAQRLNGARAAGWRIGHLPDGGITATCPTCARPDPATLAAYRELTKGTTR